MAREIQNPDVRAKYLSQVCFDDKLRVRLDGRLKARRHWQFSLRSLFIVILLVAGLSAGPAISFRQAHRALRREREARALEQRYLAVQAADKAAAALQQGAEITEASRHDVTP